MADVLTKADTTKMVNFLLQVAKQDYTASPNLTFAQFKAMTTLGNIFSDLAPKPQHKYKEVFPQLLSALERFTNYDSSNQMVRKMLFAITASILNFNSGLNYEQTFELLDNMTQVISYALQSDNLLVQSNGLSLIESLSEVCEEEDLIPIVQKFIQPIFQQFSGVMDAIQVQKEFSHTQTIYINSIVTMIGTTSATVPSLFKEHVQQIGQSLCIIIQRAQQQAEH